MTQQEIAARLRDIEADARAIRRSLFEAEQTELLPQTSLEKADARRYHGINCPCGVCVDVPRIATYTILMASGEAVLPRS